MAELTLDVARKILDAALAKGVEKKLKPLVITILDARGCVKVTAAQDGTSLMRAEIAHGKAYGALAMGMGSRALFQRAQEQAYFIDAVNTLAQGRMVPVPGGVLIQDGGVLLGAVGVSGDTSDNDEVCAVAGIEAAGLKANAGVTAEFRLAAHDRIRTVEDGFKQQLLERLKAIEQRLDALDANQRQLSEAYARSRAHLRRLWLRPPMWTYEQHPPRPLNLNALPAPPALPKQPPRIAIVTPSLNHSRFLRATIDSVLTQNYPLLSYHVQDGGSADDSVDILKGYGDRISWRSGPDQGQSDAINLGFAGVDCDIMAYLNSDDVLLPGTLACVASFFEQRPDIDFVYGHRIFIDYAGSEIGRAVFPAHNSEALKYAGYVPQELMFWRRRVWDAIGPLDTGFHYAMDWEFMLRAEAAGFKMARLRRFLACFRVHDEQKTTKHYERGRAEMQVLRRRSLGHVPSQPEIYRAMLPYLARQFIFHWACRLGILKQ